MQYNEYLPPGRTTPQSTTHCSILLVASSPKLEGRIGTETIYIIENHVDSGLKLIIPELPSVYFVVAAERESNKTSPTMAVM